MLRMVLGRKDLQRKHIFSRPVRSRTRYIFIFLADRYNHGRHRERNTDCTRYGIETGAALPRRRYMHNMMSLTSFVLLLFTSFYYHLHTQGIVPHLLEPPAEPQLPTSLADQTLGGSPCPKGGVKHAVRITSGAAVVERVDMSWERRELMPERELAVQRIQHDEHLFIKINQPK
ncbi:hypothetical protein F4861DRAFT_238293 [Xylaria intraflava]|nr:hypothetical protein F4861DRAFT_238293 [Xylaria intraflava]